jgi:phosphinothricin acetyltransferase
MGDQLIMQLPKLVSTLRQNTSVAGVGRQLLTQAIYHSPSIGLKTLLGFIFAHNQPSLQLFESLGFQRWGYLPQVAELDGVERDLLIMGYRLFN